MKIETLKDLEALVKMCNKHGVSNVSVDGITLVLAGEPEKLKNAIGKDGVQTENQYTDEEVLMWSSGAL